MSVTSRGTIWKTCQWTGIEPTAGRSGQRVTVWDGDVQSRLGALAATGSSEDVTAEVVTAEVVTAEVVTAMAFSPDGATLAVADLAGPVQLWDVASSRPLGSALPAPGDVPLSLAFDRDGSTLYIAGSHVPLHTYDIAPAHMARQVCARTGSGLSPEEWRTYLPALPYERTC